jgi:hypothetical protein
MCHGRIMKCVHYFIILCRSLFFRRPFHQIQYVQYSRTKMTRDLARHNTSVIATDGRFGSRQEPPVRLPPNTLPAPRLSEAVAMCFLPWIAFLRPASQQLSTLTTVLSTTLLHCQLSTDNLTATRTPILTRNTDSILIHHGLQRL